MDFSLYDTPQPGEGQIFTGPQPGTLETIGKGVMRGGVKTAEFGAMVGSILAPSEGEDGPDPDRILPRKEDFYRFIDDRLEPAEKFWSVDPGSLSTAGKVVSALSELPLQLVGGAVGIAGTATTSTATDLLDQGVDTDTAAAVGAGIGASTAAMVALPQASNTLFKTALLTALNPATGAATDFAAQQALEATGHKQQAAMFDPFDPAARSVDTVLGVIFGGAAHYGRWRQKAPTTVVDAIDTIERSKQAENLNPFAPGTPEAAAHAENLTNALEALDEGRPAQFKQPEKAPSYTADRFRQDVQEVFGLSDEHADAALALVAARAEVRGEDLDTFIGRSIAGIEQSTPEGATLFQDRPIVQPFYSKLLAEVEGLSQEKWNAPDLLNKLAKTPGIKGDEIAWTGLDEFLQGKKSVTRQEVAAFLQENQVRVQEVLKGKVPRYEPRKIEFSIKESEYQFIAVDKDGKELSSVGKGVVTDVNDARAYLERYLTNKEQERVRDVNITAQEVFGAKFGKYVEPGGENYRELLLTLPDMTQRVPDEIAQKLGAAQGWEADAFRSSHFDESNIFAHVRFNERTGPDGSRILHIEEVQSDWHQARRDGKDVPDAPFAKTWHELALKRVMRWAAEHGFERVTWTTGEQQAARYDLSKRMKEVRYSEQDGQYDITGRDINGEQIGFGRFDEKQLPDALGKELARKMIADKQAGQRSGVYSGHGLKLGGEGMKGFYDQMLPQYLKKFGAKFGAKVEDIKLDSGESSPTWRKMSGELDAGLFTVHSIDVTDAMRSALLYEGQPLFQGEKGAVSFLADGRAVIHAFESADITTLAHELAHIMEKDLTTVERRTFDTWLHSQVPGAKWSVDQRELFARAFERYLAEGKAPSKELEGVFSKFRQWLLTVYERITGTAIDVKLSDNVRAAFDRMLFNQKLRQDVTPEVAAVRTGLDSHRAELMAELDQHAAELGLPDQAAPIQPETVPPMPEPERLRGPLGDNLDVVNSFSRNPAKVPGILADFLNSEATMLETAEFGKVVIDGYEKGASWSGAQSWFLDRNRWLKEQGANTVGKQSVVNALKKTAEGKFNDLTPGQKDMVMEAVNDIGRQIDSMSREIDGMELQPGDRFTSVHLEPRTVVGERAGRLLLDNGESIPMDRPFKIVGEIDQAGRFAEQPLNPVDMILQERGDFEVFDGTDAAGNPVMKSAIEIINQARDAVIVEQNRQHLYHRAAVCLGLGG